MKKFATIVGTAALFGAAMLPALATGNNCSNDTTGPFSNNTCTVNNTSNVQVSNYNDAKITNDVESNVNTGHNSASYNTLGGDIVTGNATSNTVVSTVANINTTNVVGGAAAGPNTGSNHITGPGSIWGGSDGNNAVYINNDQNVNVDNQNTAVVYNDVDASSNTGYNRAKANTGPAFIKSGNGVLGVTVGTHVNDNWTQVTTGAGSTGGNTAGNSITGPFSDNIVTLNNSSDISVRNYNDMFVKNDVDASVETGDNKASYNTLGGDIVTGGARGIVGVNTEGNINTTSVQQALGGFANNGNNSTTGPGSENNTYVNNDQIISVDNANNKCWSHNADSINWGRNCYPWDLGVENFVDASSETGDNRANGNTAGGFVNATLADLWQSVVTHINDTMTTVTQ
ncbi:hypothetical protein A3D77_07005 [Candidatus Gottesmanbacteria bacterium RIFCSPHIGHO2_02_FULL_39_11]|uniref:Trimeric autotransporter adhesin YadA-like stalk domain-containing protein n=1 Tax=Candidatus Gottesmanbacteria bacterium RIFCSPHIGHO2_02_FULL_39_11 TaxID=1798382 RepID=A0A1F5ZJX1_9BACT|nr:MAG: hypothetical protein A3D77_07005 [Candidatus Gottesmanbacteria bacterium RIFCSPHIGHO2_02_FULL_39_11]